jgi:hypothetical protein
MPRKPSDTKIHLVKLCKTPLGEVYEFTTVLNEGPVVVQRMRVELGRIKKKLEKAGKPTQSFKMMVETIVSDRANNVDTVKMYRHKSLLNDVSEATALLMNELELEEASQ